MTVSNQKTLKTERLVLRAVRPTDLENIFRLFSSSDNIRYYPEHVIEEISQARDLIEKFSMEEDSGVSRTWGMAKIEDNLIIGLIRADTFNRNNDSCRISFLLGSKFRNKGYMSEALEMALNDLVTQGGFNRISSILSPDDGRCSRLLLSFGFSKEGIARSIVKTGAGSYRDGVVYAYAGK